MTTHLISSPHHMQKFGQIVASHLEVPSVIELIGDVGAGKTTFVQGLARGLGVKEPIQSPSFTVFAHHIAAHNRLLHHYDFYRLTTDPGIMKYDVQESIRDAHTITIIEWATSVENLLPVDRIIIMLTATAHLGKRQLQIMQAPQQFLQAVSQYGR